MGKKVLLAILDGWGIGDRSKSDAIYHASTPFIDALNADNTVLKSTLDACGEDVGLPAGQMGNSEVGHLNIGAGRIVYQDLVRINKAIDDGSFRKNASLLAAFDYAKKNNKKVHYLGLVSDGGVHSSTSHLKNLIAVAEDNGIHNHYIHVLTDGRDTDPNSGKEYIGDLQQFISDKKARIATVCGRYFTMDRDKRWDRIKKGYDLLRYGKGKAFHDPVEGILDSYRNGTTDEFIEPIAIVDKDNKPLATVDEHDVVIAFNFRTDRLREITIALTQQDIPEQKMQKIPLRYLTMTQYDETFKNVDLIFDKTNVKNTLGEIVSSNNLHQIRITETEKYPHVTFFFSGGREEEFLHEKRILVPSPKEVPTYDYKPEMSAHGIVKAILPEIQQQQADFICLNFANCDMVGHTGNYAAIIKAVETVDRCIRQVTEAALANGYAVIITADHGNADHALNTDGSPNTAHSMNKVPMIMPGTAYKNLQNGRLADLAPTILMIMQLDIPEEMTGKSLLS
ncbi:MAG: 2,3-bisphosphoglycerate-independent phosphoglycerate mutase [Bacteroidales bacterium]|nr:2,3-bisphosphoglycerate-independent phosphoglycerate mutase [Bacteroidales bacterium]